VGKCAALFPLIKKAACPTSNCIPKIATDVAPLRATLGAESLALTRGRGREANNTRIDYDGGNPNRVKKPIVQTQKRDDSVKEIKVVRVRD
jgi:hypothetical protein